MSWLIPTFMQTTRRNTQPTNSHQTQLSRLNSFESDSAGSESSTESFDWINPPTPSSTLSLSHTSSFESTTSSIGVTPSNTLHLTSNNLADRCKMLDGVAPKATYLDILRASNQRALEAAAAANTTLNIITPPQIGYGALPEKDKLSYFHQDYPNSHLMYKTTKDQCPNEHLMYTPIEEESFSPFTVLSRHDSTESLASANQPVTEQLDPLDMSTIRMTPESIEDDEYECACYEACCRDYDPLWDLADEGYDQACNYLGSASSMNDFYLPPISRKSGVVFRLLPGPGGRVISSSLFRVRHRVTLANFEVSEAQHPKRWNHRWNYGVKYNVAYYKTKDLNSLERLQKQAKTRPSRPTRSKQVTSSFTQDFVQSPYHTTQPRPTRQPKEKHPRYLLKQDDDDDEVPSRHEFSKTSHSLAAKDRLAMIHASDKYREVIHSRTQRQQAAKQQRAQRSTSQPKCARSTSGSQVAYRRSTPRRPRVRPTPKNVVQPWVWQAPKSTPDPGSMDLISLAHQSTDFEKFRHAFWEEFGPQLRAAFTPESGMRVTGIRLCPSSHAIRQRFMSYLSKGQFDQGISLGYHGTRANVMDNIIADGLVIPSATNGIVSSNFRYSWNTFYPQVISLASQANQAAPYVRGSSTMFVCAVAPKQRHQSKNDPPGLYSQVGDIWVTASERVVPLFLLDFESLEPTYSPWHCAQRPLKEPEEPAEIHPYLARRLLAKRHTQLHQLARGADRKHSEDSSTIVAQTFNIEGLYCFPCVCTPSNGCCCCCNCDDEARLQFLLAGGQTQFQKRRKRALKSLVVSHASVVVKRAENKIDPF